MYIKTVLIFDEDTDKFTQRLMDKISYLQHNNYIVEVQYSTSAHGNRLIHSALLLIKNGITIK